MDFLSLINSEYIYAVLIVIALLVSKIWLIPYLNKMGIDKRYFNLIQEALLLGGYAFRSEKLNRIIIIALEIVCTLEALNELDSMQKHNEAVEELAVNLFDKLNIELNKDTLDRLIRLAVALMGEKQK